MLEKIKKFFGISVKDKLISQEKIAKLIDIYGFNKYIFKFDNYVHIACDDNTEFQIELKDGKYKVVVYIPLENNYISDILVVKKIFNVYADIGHTTYKDLGHIVVDESGNKKNEQLKDIRIITLEDNNFGVIKESKNIKKQKQKQEKLGLL